jgi:hypothetical protein
MLARRYLSIAARPEYLIYERVATPAAIPRGH